MLGRQLTPQKLIGQLSSVHAAYRVKRTTVHAGGMWTGINNVSTNVYMSYAANVDMDSR